MNKNIWQECIGYLKQEIDESALNTWIKPLDTSFDDSTVTLYAPNKFVRDWVDDKYLKLIKDLLKVISKNNDLEIVLKIGSEMDKPKKSTTREAAAKTKVAIKTQPALVNNLNSIYHFDNFVDGKSNRMAKEASFQVANFPGEAYNPLLIYGGTGLGKSHLMHSIGNKILQETPSARVLYIHSETYVQNMVTALQNHKMDSFKDFYRNLDCLLIDDIQFFANKGSSQDVFFHTFNHLFEKQQQIVLTCDVYPKEIDGLEDRLKSRFAWGLTAFIEPPEFETRVAILKSKAQQKGMELNNDVAFFIAKQIRSHVRDLEGALNRVIASAKFSGYSGKDITIDYVQHCLNDVLAVQQKMISIENIQKIIADYYNIKTSDLLSNRRSRSISQPRQMAMYLCKKLTNHSLPDIGKAFGGKDHTTVIYACKKMDERLLTDATVIDDYKKLNRLLTV